MHVRQATLSQNEEPLIVCVNQVIEWVLIMTEVLVTGGIFLLVKFHSGWREGGMGLCDLEVFSVDLSLRDDQVKLSEREMLQQILVGFTCLFP